MNRAWMHSGLAGVLTLTALGAGLTWQAADAGERPGESAAGLSAPGGAESRPGENAATEYWRVLTVMTSELKARPEFVLEAPLRGGAVDAELLAKVRPTVEALRDAANRLVEASKIDHCDFMGGQLQAEGPLALMPHLSPMRQGMQLLIASACVDAQDGRGDRAAAQLAGAFRMSRHLQNENVLISSLVSISGFRLIDQAVAALLDAGAIDAAGQGELAGALRRFDPADPFRVRAAFLGERTYFVGWIRRELAGAGEGASQARDFLAGLAKEGGSKGAEVVMQTLERGQSIEPYLVLTEAFYDEMLKIWDEPDAAAKIAQLESRADKNEFGPLTTIILPSGSKVLEQSRGAEARLAALQSRVTSR
ncbi:MAG: hypothetical protein SFZ24_07710 [Planctomycetota bacterium]|nr:hypothetical protein [Planctomycetota bacterium]